MPAVQSHGARKEDGTKSSEHNHPRFQCDVASLGQHLRCALPRGAVSGHRGPWCLDLFGSAETHSAGVYPGEMSKKGRIGYKIIVSRMIVSCGSVDMAVTNEMGQQSRPALRSASFTRQPKRPAAAPHAPARHRAYLSAPGRSADRHAQGRLADIARRVRRPLPPALFFHDPAPHVLVFAALTCHARLPFSSGETPSAGVELHLRVPQAGRRKAPARRGPRTRTAIVLL